MSKTLKGDNEDVYKSFNLILRRKAKENNFKAVLETIRDLMNTKCVVPAWIQNILLGEFFKIQSTKVMSTLKV